MERSEIRAAFQLPAERTRISLRSMRATVYSPYSTTLTFPFSPSAHSSALRSHLPKSAAAS